MSMKDRFNQNPAPYIGGAVVLGLLLLGLMWYVIASNGVTNDGNKKQERLIAHYNETTNVLSNCLVKTKQSIGATNAQTKALNKVITDAVQGRYTEGSTASPGSGGQLFSAIQEAYPDTSGLSKTFQDVLITINGCRTEFRNTQSQLQNAVSRFNEWRKGSWTVRTLGGGDYPNDDLVIKVNNRPVTGNDALAHMRTLVVVEEAQAGRDSGKIDNEDPWANN